MAGDALFEIGLEEMPARFIDDAEEQLLHKTETWLEELRISYSSIVSYATPRRLSVIIHDIADKQAELEEEKKGPALTIAKDTEGNWTKAAIGFTKGQGKTTDDIYTKDVKGTSYIFVKKYIEGKPTSDMLSSFKTIIESVSFPQTMHWSTETLRYVRPIRWITALYGSEVIPFTIAHVSSDRKTYGHRFLGETISLDKPASYVERLQENFVIADPAQREEMIVAGIKQTEKDAGVQIPLTTDLLQEVRNLVEYPTVFMGRFDGGFLELPSEVLMTSMKEHQRYFPVMSPDGDLLSYFVGVRNGDDHEIETVIRGNEKVLRARLADAQFFYEEDQQQSIAFYMEKLKKVVFQEKMGTIYDKVIRVVSITDQLADLLRLDHTTKQKAMRAAEICKFDLMTNMVNEFTELQGLMGEKYARLFGEDEMVAKAIYEHHLPRHSKDKFPETQAGAIVSIADKLDTIVGCISTGLAPTGSQDPYGLRRQAIGVLNILRYENWNLQVESLLDIVSQTQESSQSMKMDDQVSKDDVQAFMNLRATYLLKEATIEPDIIQAILANKIGVVTYTMDKARVLSTKREEESFKHTEEAFTRVLNIAGKAEDSIPEINTALFTTSSEMELYEKAQEVSITYQQAKENMDAAQALRCLEGMAEAIHSFFDQNMVMADDKSIRDNRLGLLQMTAASITDYADMTQISWKQHY